MAEAFIVEAIRTAGGRQGGRLAGWHPADLTGDEAFRSMAAGGRRLVR